MKIALCTTTIHVPHVLKLMRKCSADVHFFVALEKDPPKALGPMDQFMMDFPHLATWVTHGSSQWKCSEAIGWNTLARRNIAFLEALKWGADLIVSWDNDNIPVNENYFEDFEKLFVPTRRTQTNRLIDGFMVPYETRWPFNGIKVTGDKGWFDSGLLLIPPTRHRGFPHARPPSKSAVHVTDARVGVAAELVIGDPDVDATTRLEHKPDIGAVHILGSTGVVVDPHTWTVFNSQNTAVIRELIPAWFMMPGVGRHDDIYASLIVQRVARERNLHVHLGPPFTYQQRNPHNLTADLRAEIDGMDNVCKLARLLDAVVLPAKWSVSHDVRIIYNQLAHADFIPRPAVDAALAWLEDCEGLGL